MEFKNTKSHITLFDLEKGGAVSFVSGLVFFLSFSNEFGFDLGLSSSVFFAYLEKPFCEVYDQRYGEVKMTMQTFKSMG